jgi:hypothetical protein
MTDPTEQSTELASSMRTTLCLLSIHAQGTVNVSP